jgi:hypothetical protein
MLVNDKDAVARLASPMNLMNRLSSAKNSRNSAMSLFGIGCYAEPGRKNTATLATQKPAEEVKITFNPFQALPTKQSPVEQSKALQPLTASVFPQISTVSTEPLLSDILENHDSQIKLGLAHDKALELLNRSVDLLATKLDDVKADKLPSVISAASKTVESIRRERSEAFKNGKDKEVHYHFYTPIQKTIQQFEVIDVT